MTDAKLKKEKAQKLVDLCYDFGSGFFCNNQNLTQRWTYCQISLAKERKLMNYLNKNGYMAENCKQVGSKIEVRIQKTEEEYVKLLAFYEIFQNNTFKKLKQLKNLKVMLEHAMIVILPISMKDNQKIPKI